MSFGVALGIGIVGLPNVGKSTLFNALTKAQNAEAANYPFCTIDANHAIVPVPDARLAALAAIVNPARIVAATVEFVDIAGLVRGASRGEGLGNRFLGNIRETQAIVHVVRCFDDADIAHVDGSVDPVRDVEVIETELLLADVETVETRIGKLERQAKGDKTAKAELDRVRELATHLDGGAPASTFARREELPTDLHLLSSKTVIYCANVDEAGLTTENPHAAALAAYAKERGRECVRISAAIEAELAGLEDDERAEFLADYGIPEGGLEAVIRKSYRALDLASYFTAGPKEVRAWTIGRGWPAPRAAGVIHTDFERAFIRAEVIPYETYVELGGDSACRDAGKLRVEGKDYVIADGDVVHFRVGA